MPDTGSADQHSGAFARAFLPGLVLGLVIGGVCGAVLPPLIDGGPRIQRNPDAANAGTSPRERGDDAADLERQQVEDALRQAEEGAQNAGDDTPTHEGGDAPAPPAGVDPDSDD